MAKNQSPKNYKNKTSAMPTIISISLVLVMLGIFGLIFLNINKIYTHLKENIEVIVELKDNVNETDAVGIIVNFKQLDFVKKVKLVTKDEAANELQEKLGQNFVEEFGYNPLPNYLKINLKSDFVDEAHINTFEEKLNSIEGVSEVKIKKSILKKLVDNATLIGFILITLSTVFLMIALGLINSTIRLNVYSQRFIIKTMQLIGAKERFILKPIMWLFVLYGFISTILASAAIAGILYLVYDQFPNFKNLIGKNDYILIFVALMVVGTLIVSISTYFTTKRYLKMNIEKLY